MDDLELPVLGAPATEQALTALLQAICASILDELPTEGLELLRNQCAAAQPPTDAERRLRQEIETRMAQRGTTLIGGRSLPPSG